MFYKRKQEKKERKQELDQESDQEKKKVFWSSSCFLTFFYINSHLRAILDDKSHISDKSAIGAPTS